MLGFEVVELKGAGKALLFRPVDGDGYALVKSGHADCVPSHPESEVIRIDVCAEDGTKISSMQARGRAGLNDWFELRSGYRPDDERLRPIQIDELIRMVCQELMAVPA